MKYWAAVVVAITVTVGVHGSGRAAEMQLVVDEEFDAHAIDVEHERLTRRLREALSEFDGALASISAFERDRWRDYLMWDAWARPVVESPTWNSDSRDIAAMQRWSKRLYAASDGFEHPLIGRLRDSMTEFLFLEEALKEAGGDLEGEFHRRVERLELALQSDPVDFEALEEAAWWLTATRQAPRSLAKLQAKFSGPVIVGLVHRDIIEDKLDSFENSSYEVRQTRNNIQGATVVGTATVQSRAVAQLFDAPDDARLRIVTTGEVLAPHNVSSAGRVRVTSSSRSKFTGVADVYWDAERVAATRPRVTANMRSQIKTISAPRLGRRIARRRVYESRGSAQAQGESLIERQVAEAMSGKLATAVKKLNQKSKGVLSLLNRTGNKARHWQTAVLPEAILIGYVAPSQTGLGSTPNEIQPLAGEETLGLSLHDSAIESILRAQVAGAVWKDTQFATLQRELTGGNSEELMIGLEPGRWSVQWKWRLPVRIHFSDGYATVHYRFSSAEIDGAAHDIPFEARAEIEVVATPLGMRFCTRGAAVVESLSRQNALPTDVQMFLEHKFAGLFGEEFYLDGLQFPAGGHLDGMSAFRVSSARIVPGWAHLRYTNRTAKTQLVGHKSGSPTLKDASRSHEGRQQ